MQKQIYLMTQILQQNNLGYFIPNCAKRRSEKIRIPRKEILAML
jgi:hypothetical protein